MVGWGAGEEHSLSLNFTNPWFMWSTCTYPGVWTLNILGRGACVTSPSENPGCWSL